MAGHELIDAHLAVLSRRLPDSTVEEVADGLIEAWEAHQAAGMAPTAAAQSALAEFGDPDQIAEAFVTQSQGRRIAKRLLFSGPLVGACWALTFVTAQASTWPIPRAATAVFGLGLASVIMVLVAATKSHSYRLTQLGGSLGGLGTILLDSGLLAALLLVGPKPVWAMTAAIPASLARILLTVRLLPTVRTP